MKKVGYLLVGLALVLNLFFVSSFQDSYGTLKYDTRLTDVLVTGAKIGVWTYDLNASRALAKINGRPLILKLGSSSCGSCIDTNTYIYSQPEFKQWAKDNGFALAYANADIIGGSYVKGELVGGHRLPILNEFVANFPDITGFPPVFLFYENDEKKNLNKITFAMKMGVSIYMEAAGANAGPRGFKAYVEYAMNMRDNLLITNESSRLKYFPTSIFMGSQKKYYNLYNEYGKNSLKITIPNGLGIYAMRKDLVDWYNVTNIFQGKKYSIRAINVSDLDNLGKVSFYSGFDNAKNGISFKEMSLNDFSKGYQFTAANNQDIYMKIWRDDPVPTAELLRNYSVLHNISLKGPTVVFEGIDKVEYNLEYYQTEDSIVSSPVPNETINQIPSENTSLDNLPENTLSQNIYNFINRFSGWFSSEEKLNISYSGSVAGEWTTDYNSAKELSVTNNRPMIILFGKNQNEQYTKKFAKDVLNSPALKEYAKVKGLPLVVLDFSNKSSLSQEAMRKYPKDVLGTIVKLPTLMYLDSNQDVLGTCVYRNGVSCNSIKVKVNITNFVEILESFTGQIFDLGFDEPSYEDYDLDSVLDSGLEYEPDCTDGSCSMRPDNTSYSPNVSSVPISDPVVLPGSHVYNTYQDSYGTLKWAEEPMHSIAYMGGGAPTRMIEVLSTGAQVGEWTYDWGAAKALSKINGRPLLLWFAGPGCVSCESAKDGIFSKPEFKQWAKDNKFTMVFINGACHTDTTHADYKYCNPTIKEFVRLYPGYTAYTLLILADGNNYSRDFAMYYTYSLSSFKTLGSGNIKFQVSTSGFVESVDFSINARDDSINTSKLFVSPVLLNVASQKKNYNLYNEYGNNSLRWFWTAPNQKAQDVVDWYNITGISNGGKYFVRAINVSDFRRMNLSGSLPYVRTPSDVRNKVKVSFYSGLQNAQNGISFKEMSLNEVSNGYQFIAANNQDVYMKVWREKVNLSNYDTYRSYVSENNLLSTYLYDSIEYNIEYYRI